MKYSYFPTGVCSDRLILNLMTTVKSQAVSLWAAVQATLRAFMLVKGMDAKDAVDRLKGIDCRGRGTSCPDQLSKALVEALKLI